MANPPTDYFVDPSIAADSGAGTLGDPYGDLQYALNTVTRDSTDGDRFNVKAGTAESISSPLSLATYGTPAHTAPLFFQGYTSAQGDGGVGIIDLAATAATVITNAGNCINWIDMEIRNGDDTDYLLQLPLYGLAFRCYVHDNNGGGIETLSQNTIIAGCQIEDVGDATHSAILINGGAESCAIGNYIRQNGSRAMEAAITMTNSAQGVLITQNIISLDTSADNANGIVTDSTNSWSFQVIANTILSNAGTGSGIQIEQTGNNLVGTVVANNYIEGFSGTGGIGYDMNQSSTGAMLIIANAAYNNATNTSIDSEHGFIETVEALSGTGLSKSGSDTFANRFTYFAPIDEGGMIDEGWPESA